MAQTNISGGLSSLFMQSSMLSAKGKQSPFLSSAKAPSSQAASLTAMNKALMSAFSGALTSFQKSSMTMATANYSSMSKALASQQLNFSAQMSASLKQSYKGSQLSSYMNLRINATAAAVTSSASAAPSGSTAAVTEWYKMDVSLSMTEATTVTGTAATAPAAATTAPSATAITAPAAKSVPVTAAPVTTTPVATTPATTPVATSPATKPAAAANATTSNASIATVQVTDSSVKPQFLRINSVTVATPGAGSVKALEASAPSAISAPGGNGRIKFTTADGYNLGSVDYKLTGKETNLEALNKIAESVNANIHQVKATVSADGLGRSQLNITSKMGDNFSISDTAGNATEFITMKAKNDAGAPTYSTDSARVVINRNEGTLDTYVHTSPTVIVSNDNVIEMNGYNINLNNNLNSGFVSRDTFTNEVKVRVGVANDQKYTAVSSDTSSVVATGGEMGVKGIASSSVRVRVDQLAQNMQITGKALAANEKTGMEAGTYNLDIVNSQVNKVTYTLTGNETNQEALGKIASAINNNREAGVSASVSTSASGKTSLVLEGTKADNYFAASPGTDNATGLKDIRSSNASTYLGLENSANVTQQARFGKVTIESNLAPTVAGAANVAYNDIKTPSSSEIYWLPTGSSLNINQNKFTFQSNDIELQFNKTTGGKWVDVYLK